jgi:polyprenyl P-hydroxybenzoate/phenylacrylic acid decarboxylase-like protein
MATPPSKRIIVGITGASGAIYAVRTVRALLLRGFEVHLVISKFGERLLADEANVALSKEGFVERILRETPRPAGLGCVVRHDVRDLGASISSGSFCTAGMVVVPCTTKTLAGIARGFSSNLIERAADVCLKERRNLVLVVREAPLSLVHLRNMAAVTEAGGVILPASPGFYQRPESFEDLGDFIAGRVLNVLGLEQDLFTPWGEPD